MTWQTDIGKKKAVHREQGEKKKNMASPRQEGRGDGRSPHFLGEKGKEKQAVIRNGKKKKKRGDITITSANRKKGGGKKGITESTA